MLADEDEKLEVKPSIKFYIKKIILSFNWEEDNDLERGIIESDDENESNDGESEWPTMNKNVRIFLKLKINFMASCYHKMTPISQWQTIPPILKRQS